MQTILVCSMTHLNRNPSRRTLTATIAAWCKHDHRPRHATTENKYEYLYRADLTNHTTDTYSIITISMAHNCKMKAHTGKNFSYN